MTENNQENKNSMPAIQGSYKSLLNGALSPLIFVIIVTILMVLIAHFKGA